MDRLSVCSADLPSVSDKIGSLEGGKAADSLVWSLGAVTKERATTTTTKT